MRDYRAQLVITVAEAAEWLKTSEEAILKLAEDGRIPAVRYTPDDPPVFRPEDVVAFVERQSGSRQPSGVFSVVSGFAPMDVRGVPMPPVPPAPPVPPFAPVAPRGPVRNVRAFTMAPTPPTFESAFEFAFSTEGDDDIAEIDVLRSETERLQAEAEVLRSAHDALAAEMEAMRQQLSGLRDEQDR